MDVFLSLSFYYFFKKANIVFDIVCEKGRVQKKHFTALMVFMLYINIQRDIIESNAKIFHSISTKEFIESMI